MPRYTALTDFDSHLGHHAEGEELILADDTVAAGFVGFIERADEPDDPEASP